MQAGKLRHRIDIEQQVGTSTNEYNEVTTGWAALVSSLPAQVETTGGDERRYQQQTEAGMTHVVLIRYRSDVTPTMRVKWGTRVLHIESVVETDNRGRSLVLLCKEVV